MLQHGFRISSWLTSHWDDGDDEAAMLSRTRRCSHFGWKHGREYRLRYRQCGLFVFGVDDFNEVEDFGNINIESLFFLGGSQYIVACEAPEGLNTGPVVFHIYCLGPARCIVINLNSEIFAGWRYPLHSSLVPHQMRCFSQWALHLWVCLSM